MRSSLHLVALGLAAWMPAQAGGVTVEQVVALVRSSVHRGASDRSLAKSLHKLELTESLDGRTIEELESLGAGPDAVAELERLREISAQLPAPPVPPLFPVPPRPTLDEQKRLFAQLAVNALNYTASLPNFICTQVIRRYTDRRWEGTWDPHDVLTVRLTYFENRENYQLLLVNGKSTRESYKSVGGATSEGDFATTLVLAFAPMTETKFLWDHWTHLRKRLTHVYSYRTSQEKSHYRITMGPGGADRDAIVAGRHGFVYADDEAKMVFRITGEADSIPSEFPVSGVSTVLDYDFTSVSGRRFLLPLRADVRLRTVMMQYRNVVEFHDYRKFTSDSTITFGPPTEPRP